MTPAGRSNARAVAITALAAGAKQTEAAAKAGVGERTIRRWLAQPAFRQQVAETQAEMVARATAKLADSMTAAVLTLRRLLEASSESVQLAAARSILELGIKLRESEELTRRIEALEAVVNKE